MLDFVRVVEEKTTKNTIKVYPKFIMKNPSSDLMIRGGDFYAIWIEEQGVWSTSEQDAIDLIDKEIDEYVKTNDRYDANVLYMWDSDSGMIDKWHKYCQKQMRDSYNNLDEKLIFSNDPTNKKDYASKRLSYPLEYGETPAWDRLIGTLYSEEERHKIEWSIGSIVSGDSKTLQKFMVLYGAAGTGKSTILNVIQQLFEGYWAVFDAKALGSNSNSFALEAFKHNPLVAIQHDGDLSKIEDNSVINSLVSHERMMVNEKYKSTYATHFNAFLYLGTNRPVKITDAKSGLIRRLIDVHPSGNKLTPNEYKKTMNLVSFELGKIATKCKGIYLSDPDYYDDYIPLNMMGASNDFYNFMIDNYHIFKREDGTTLKAAWEMYKVYCDEANVPYKASKMRFKEELKNYFWEFKDRFNLENGERVSSYYKGFRIDRFEPEVKKEKPKNPRVKNSWIQFKEGESIFDETCADCQAQYATSNETPAKAWNKVRTKLSALDTSKLHYVKVPENHIVIDFDLKNEKGEKDVDLNLAAASNWPPTYVELSKSGCGLHLHYIYTGDVYKLSRIYDDAIEIKIFNGGSSLRRKLTKCNDIPIATISSGLPLKEDSKMINKDVVQTEKGLRTTIKKCVNKEVHANTRPNIDFIKEILDQAYTSGMTYDVTDLKNEVVAFAAASSNQSDYCLKLVNKMQFKSEEPSVPIHNNVSTDELVFYDCEVFPNLFLVNWKFAGEGKPVVRMINPTPEEIEGLLKFNLVGFNCRRYDNHMLYACMIGYSNEQLYNLSQKIINTKKGTRGVFFGEAYNISYTDIYDFASAGNKKSLKKLEIEMGIHHQELGLPWDEPVPKELWNKVAEYCDNDVIATEAAFHYLSGDWTARLILAELADMTPNDTTNSLTTKIIFDGNKKPQSEFCYRDMSQPVKELDPEVEVFLKEACPKMMAAPHGKAKSLLPYFEGYKYEGGISTYLDEIVGEGGYVHAKPGAHINVALLDVSSMHPHSTIAECLFGPRFTRAFREVVEGRVSIKHKAWDEVNDILNGKLTPFIQRVIAGEMTAKELANGLKTAINSVYGLTAAAFENAFNDPRNIDNIVAKRGALFMLDLKYAVEAKGFTVAHIKTDSIKIPNATPEIIEFVMEFGERYGYTFEHEATYDRMCLVNDAVYIAKYKDASDCEAMYGYIPDENREKGGAWTATGKQFAVPYVFKTLFSKEDITLEDMCETFSVSTALYLDMNETLEDVTKLEQELFVIRKGDREYERQKELESIIAENHDYRFVGKVGLFTPIQPGCGGGELVREGLDKFGNIKYSSATGAKGFRWLESEIVSELGLEDKIDKSFYHKLVDDAVDTIDEYISFEEFVLAGSSYFLVEDNPPWEEVTPFDVR